MTRRVLVVSIHAPARGATKISSSSEARRMFQSTRPRGARRFEVEGVDIAPQPFQSTRPRGARRYQRIGLGAPRSFNPRAREGRDHVIIMLIWPDAAGFNPRAREGRDYLYTAYRTRRVTFQSTRPRGARHGTLTPTPLSRGCFNPRAREGRDTTTAPFSSFASLSFNPRAREGRD